MQHKLTTCFYPVSISTTYGIPHTYSPHVSVAWCFGYWNNLLHALPNPLVLSLMCSHLNSRHHTTTIYFSCSLHQSLYAIIRRCWISSAFDKTSFTSKSASSREKTFSTINHSSWHNVTRDFSQAINNTCHITLFYGGLCYFEWHKAHCNVHLCNFIPLWHIYSLHAYDWEELSTLAQTRCGFYADFNGIQPVRCWISDSSLICFNLVEYIMG